ncbi:hypothetical protein [Lacinutrix salivirga]
MNKLVVPILCILTLFLTSCQFSENIYINEDGSGKMEFAFDGSQLMQMAGDKMKEGNEKAMDSTFSFKELFDAKRDSISKLPAEEQEKLKSLEKFSMHMKMDPEASLMQFEMFTDFKNASELQDMFKAMNNFSNMKGKGKAEVNTANNPFSSLGENGATELKYNYDGKTFSRSVTVTDKELYKQMTDSIGEMGAMFGSSTYKLNYHFPKPVKSVSNENAMFSADRKTVTLEFPFMKYMTDPEALNLEVILED